MDESKNVTEKNTKATERQIQSVQRAINILNCFTMTNSAPDAGTDQQSAQFEQRHSPWNSEYALQNGYISQNGNGQYMLGRRCLTSLSRCRDAPEHVH